MLTLSVFVLFLFNVVELKPILAIEYSQAAVQPLSSEIMSRLISTIGNKPVIIQGFLAEPNTNKITVRRQLNDDDVSIQTIFYDSNNKKVPSQPSLPSLPSLPSQPSQTPSLQIQQTNNNNRLSVVPYNQNNDVVIHTITYTDTDSNNIQGNLKNKFDNQIFSKSSLIGKDYSGVDWKNAKTSYDVPLHSVEALPPHNYKRNTGALRNSEDDSNFGLDVRIGGDAERNYAKTLQGHKNNVFQEKKIPSDSNIDVYNIQIPADSNLDPVAVLKTAIRGFSEASISKAIPKFVIRQ